MPPTKCCKPSTTSGVSHESDGQSSGARMRSGCRRSIVTVLASASFLSGSLCMADSSCAHMAVKPSVRIGGGELTLADLLSPDTCQRVRAMAKRVPLGAAPLPGAVRVVPGPEIGSWLESLAAAAGRGHEEMDELPPRILVRRAGAAKSCSEIASLVLPSLLAGNRAGISPQHFDCAAAQSVPEAAPLELTRTFWNASLRRWEFSLRCSQAEDCAPFLVWAPARSAGQGYFSQSDAASLPSFRASPGTSAGKSEKLIRSGETATLRWDEAGIRIVLPVTCLDPGGIGQTIRVRFKNTARILRAEILSDGTLRAGL